MKQASLVSSPLPYTIIIFIKVILSILTDLQKALYLILLQMDVELVFILPIR